jgi:mannose-6-phosphate isomerase-like protein (cupin superfamily)
MKKTLMAVVVVSALPLGAAEKTGIAVWPSAELKGYTQKLGPKINEQKLALENLGAFGNHSTLIAHRQGDGEAEVHDTQADIFFVQEGQATLVLGGEVADGKTIAAGEVRGPSIRNGQRFSIQAGDVVHIPSKTAHQLLLPAGSKFTYFVVKIDAP